MPDHNTPTVSFLSILKWTDDQCREFLEASRWPDGPVCPKCGEQEPYRIERKSRTKNKVTKLYRCKSCRKDYTATVGSIFEDSKIPLQKWFAGIFLMCSSKKGMSAHQLHRQLEVTYKSAWFMCHRIREAMKDKSFAPMTGVVEVDETYIGGKPRGHRLHRIEKHSTMSERITAAWAKKEPVLGIVERGGRVRTVSMGKLTRKSVQETIIATVDTERTALMSDEHMYYYGINRTLPHGIIRHKSEYVRGAVHTQGIESYWAILKRGLYGTFHHVDAAYLSMYLPEFEFRYNRRKISDAERFVSLMQQVSGRRVTWYCETPQPKNPYA